MRAKVPHADFAFFQAGHMNSPADQQKAALFKSDVCVNCSLYITMLLTIDIGPFFALQNVTDISLM